MASKPAFSVLIPAYNAEATLAETLDSVLSQTRGDWEAIVIDDGSTDSTAAIAREHASRDSRIRFVAQANGGTGSARNTAARQARAVLLAPLDADDLYLPEFLERMGRFVDDHPDFDIYSVDGFQMLPGGETVPDDLHPDANVRSYTPENLLVRNRIRVFGVFRRSVFDLVGGFDEDPRMRNEDYDFWLRALLAGARHIHNPERLTVYRSVATAKRANLLSCYEADVYMLDRLIAGGMLDGKRRRIARRSRRQFVRFRDVERDRTLRARLEAQLQRGHFEGARSLYLRSRHAWANPLKYVAVLPLALVSPRLLARVLARTATPATKDGIGDTRERNLEHRE